MDADELELWKRYRSVPGDETRGALVLFYLPLLERIASRNFSTVVKIGQLEVDDLVNDAVPALMQLIDSFDLSRGLKFNTYATLRIRGAMVDAIRERDFVPRLERVRQHANPDHPIKQVFPLVREKRNDGYDDGENSHLTAISTPAAKVERSRLDEDEFWKQACRGLSRNERIILMAYYRQGLTMKEIGRSLDISESRISQMMSSVIERIRSRPDVDELLDLPF